MKMKRKVGHARTCAAAICSLVAACFASVSLPLRAEVVETETNYERLVREGRNVWRLTDGNKLLVQTNEVGQWALPVGWTPWSKSISLNSPSAESGSGVLDLIDAVIVDGKDAVQVDFASEEGQSWVVQFSYMSLKSLAATDFRCNRLHQTEGYAAFSGNETLKRVTLGGPALVSFMKYDLSKYVTNVTISAATNLTGFASDAFSDTWSLRYLTFDDLPKLKSFPGGSLGGVNRNWPLREVVFLGKPFIAACMTNLLNGVETEDANKLSGAEPCTVYVSKRQWPYAERVASGYWKPVDGAGLAEAELAKKPDGCLGIIDVSPNASTKHRAWVVHRDSPYDKKSSGFCLAIR